MKTPSLMLMLLIFSVTAFAQKNVAVLEIDRHPDVREEISSREAMEITNVIRAEAVNTLPRSRYSVMTTESIMAMGGAVLEECAGETCIMTIGRAIDADYVVRGTLSKFQARYTLNVEMFETDFGNLVATAAPIRSANLEEILDKSGPACVDMYRKFMGAEPPSAPQTAAPAPAAIADAAPKKNDSSLRLTLQISAGALALGGFVGGFIVNRMVETEYDKYDRARSFDEADKTRKNAENYMTTRNVLYVLGAVGLSGFAVTLFF